VLLSAVEIGYRESSEPLFAELTLQACTEESCLPPDKIRIPVHDSVASEVQR
jgi:hypothetical protein